MCKAVWIKTSLIYSLQRCVCVHCTGLHAFNFVRLCVSVLWLFTHLCTFTHTHTHIHKLFVIVCTQITACLYESLHVFVLGSLHVFACCLHTSVPTMPMLFLCIYACGPSVHGSTHTVIEPTGTQVSLQLLAVNWPVCMWRGLSTESYNNCYLSHRPLLFLTHIDTHTHTHTHTHRPTRVTLLH